VLPDTPLLLTVLVLLVAFIVAARTALAWDALQRLSADVRARTTDLDGRSVDLPRTVGRTRAQLAAASSTIEQSLRTLPLLDARMEALSHDLQARRAQLDELRTGPLAGARGGFEKIRSTVRLVLRLATLRRKMLG
jgi:phytoene dehydrogenase-like protein